MYTKILESLAIRHVCAIPASQYSVGFTFHDLLVAPAVRSQQNSCRLLEAPYKRLASLLKLKAVMGSESCHTKAQQ